MIVPRYFTESHFPEMNRLVGDFISTGIWGKPGRIERYSTMGVFAPDGLIAGSCFHNWQPDSGVLELSSYSRDRRWLTAPVVRAMMAFPFSEMGAQMVALRVSERNAVMVSIARRFGFTGHLIPRLRGRDEAEWVFTLTDDDWRSHRMNRRG